MGVPPPTRSPDAIGEPWAPYAVKISESLCTRSGTQGPSWLPVHIESKLSPVPKPYRLAVPSNLKLGLHSEAQHRVPTVEVEDLLAAWPHADYLLVDIREEGERQRSGTIPGSIHCPYGRFDQFCGKSGLLAGMAREHRVLLYCAVGERSTLAVEGSRGR